MLPLDNLISVVWSSNMNSFSFGMYRVVDALHSTRRHTAAVDLTSRFAPEGAPLPE